VNGRRTGRLILLGIVILMPVTLHADDDKAIYESLPDVTIGRVFFSPEQRARLDQQRQGVFVAGATRSSVKAGRPKKNNRAAGYISSSQGPTRVYANGDFVKASDGESLVFPGTVKVVRGADTEDDEASDEDD